jgi:F-type H+-transporting ATPase subunit alpha
MNKNLADKISRQILKQISRFKLDIKKENIGTILQVGDGVAAISGLPNAMYNELLLLPQNTLGLALNLKPDRVEAVILGSSQHLKAGDTAKSTGQLLTIPVGENLISRIIDPLGQPLDGKPKPISQESYPLERIAPGVIKRKPVNIPVQTGIKAIDSIIPIGRGQRELIIGDRNTGKSSIPITTIINQKGQKLICIYVAIGQKESFIARTASTLEKFGCFDHTIIVAAAASVSPTLQYLAPYAGCAIGEYFAYNGQDALVVYDDLTKHAWAYRELSLLLRRPSGREAYPGDIFYLHSRLLERACKLNPKNGGGSLTALPIIETQAGDISSYIPTNVISITDGQIYLEPDLFHAGVRPAINIGLSVSRVGGAAQLKAMKKVAGKLRLDLAQYRELAAFAQFSSDLDPQSQAMLERGTRVTEILKQNWDQPMPVEQQIIVIWAVTNGFIDKVETSQVKEWEKRFLAYIESAQPEIISELERNQELSDKLVQKLSQAASTFNDINPELIIEEQKEEEN